MPLALVREVSPSIANCELTHLERDPIDSGRARVQHEAYVEALAGLGFRIVRLPAEPDLPDAVFVEDTAVVLDELAVITRPGAVSRRPETVTTAAALRAWRPVVRMEGPGTLDGGDVLRVDRILFVGLSSRTDPAGVAELESRVSPFGYEVRPLPLDRCLHLKSAVTRVGARLLLLNRDWIDAGAFEDLELVEVDPSEPAAANALLAGSAVVHPAGFPKTGARLRARGIPVVPVAVSELAKAEGGVTCCSILLHESGE